MNRVLAAAEKNSKIATEKNKIIEEKQKEAVLEKMASFFGADGENRTHDLFITSELLYP